MSSKRTLKDVLSDKVEFEEEEETDIEVNEVNTVDPGSCCECGDQPKQLLCINCSEEFCQVCFDFLHRTGKRKDHNVEYLVPLSEINAELSQPVQKETELDQPMDTPMDNLDDFEGNIMHRNIKIQKDAKFIPMRLSPQERKLYRLLDAALEVSEYTDRIDIYHFSSKSKRIVKELREICQVLTGLVVASEGIDSGKALLESNSFIDNANWFKAVFEIGRRYKIMNPSEMRTNYGKLMYMIMDSRLPEIQQVLEFDLYKPVITVESYLEELGKLSLLEDELLPLATMEILNINGKTRQQLNMESKQKHDAVDSLCEKYGEDVRRAIYSLGDFNSYIAANTIPVANMIKYLKANYDPQEPEGEYGLGISSGHGGARLTHNHKKQYQYVIQSLNLWFEIMGDTYLLWKYADDDLMSETHRYRLENTGQGLNRVKPSPKVNRLMHGIIQRAQQQTGFWVGSSVVHLGDRDVPNSMFFLDKYLQVPRILNPINAVVKQLPDLLAKDKFALDFANKQFGSVDVLIKVILTDFFRHAFDGSGADNFYDAGSCIDGRLTSAWNWTNTLQKKKYYKFFLIAGFIGFDGTNGF